MSTTAIEKKIRELRDQGMNEEANSLERFYGLDRKVPTQNPNPNDNDAEIFEKIRNSKSQEEKNFWNEKLKLKPKPKSVEQETAEKHI